MTLRKRVDELINREAHIHDPYEIFPGNIAMMEGLPVKQGYFGAFKDEDESVTWALEEMMDIIKAQQALLDRAIMGLEDAANSLHIAAVDMELLETKDEEWAHLVKGDDASKRTWARQDDAQQTLADIRKQLDGDGNESN